MFRKLLIISVLMLLAGAGHATHMSGGEIYWDCLGNGQYRFRLIVYRDCAGINVDPSYNLVLTSPCGNRNLTVTTNGGTELSQLCDLELPNSTCNGGTLPGIQQYIYTGTITLPPCDSWEISWTNIYRNNAIVNLTAPGTRQMYIEAVMNSADAPCNDSPTFTNSAIPYVCLGYPISYSYGAVDAEGDSLSYELIDARMINGTDIPYVAPFGGNTPITGLTLDPVTGLINFTLNIAGNWVVAALVTEYDANGNVIGTVMRDMQFVAFPCSNVPPDPATGTVQNVTGSAVQTGPRAVDVCEFGDVCFDMVINDVNADNVLDAFSNIQQNLPGATFTFTGSNPITAQICWTAQAGTAGFYPFIVNVNDGACPIPAFQTYVYTVRVIPGLAAELVAVDESCQGSGNGSLEVVVTTGTGPYSYTWSTGSSESLITGGAGDYSVDVIDANGCQAPTLVGVIATSALENEADAGPDMVVCAGQSTFTLAGTVTNASGGAWSNGTGSLSGTWPTISYTPSAAEWNTGSAELILSTTGNNGCPPGTDTLVFTLANSFSATSTTGTDATCNGTTTGTATVAPLSGGTTLIWNDPGMQTTATAIGLGAGTYQVTLTDSYSCDSTLSVVISEPDALALADLIAMEESCTGTANGTLTAAASGGTSPYSYTWNTGATGPVLTAGEGTYDVQVTDANGCAPAAASGIIMATGAPNVADAGGDLIVCEPLAPFALTGSVQNATGGAWSGGSGTFTGSGLNVTYLPSANEVAAGSVELQLTTSGNSTCPPDSDLVLVSLSNAFHNATLTTTNTDCFGTSNGIILYSPQINGSTYLWNDPQAQATPTASGLSAGTYTITVTDALGCDSSFSATITEPAELVVTNINTTPVACAGGSSGSAAITVAGGTPTYTVVWSNGQTGASLSGLSAGALSVDVTDAQGCMTQADAVITGPTPITVIVDAPDTVCVNAPVTLTAVASGGAGGYLYDWGGLGFNSTVQLAFSSAQSLTLTVTDAAGCLAPTTTIPIAVLDLGTASLSTYGDTTVCFGGMGTVGAQLSGYPGSFTYSWPELGGTGTGPYAVPINDDRIVHVVVTDECGNTLEGSIGLGLEIAPTFELPPILAEGCAPLYVQFPSLGLGNVIYNWDLGNGNSTNVPAPQVTYGPGNYAASLTVTTPLGCTSSSDGGGVIIAHALPYAAFTADPWSTNIDAPLVQFTDQSTGEIMSYDWTFGDGGTSTNSDPSYSFSEVGTFNVELIVTNIHGCSSTAEHEVRIDPVYDVVIPTAFTPNPNGPGGPGNGNGGNWVTGDLSNDVFYPFVRFVKDFRMRIFNRWGELIFESTDLKIGWDGYYRGEISPQDVYVVQSWFRFVDGKQVEKLSDLTLFR